MPVNMPEYMPEYMPVKSIFTCILRSQQNIMMVTLVHHNTVFVLDLKYENNVHVYVKTTGQQTQLIKYDTSRLCYIKRIVIFPISYLCMFIHLPNII